MTQAPSRAGPTDTEITTLAVNGVGDLLRAVDCDEVIATVGDADSFAQLVKAVGDLSDGTVVQAVVDGDALDSVSWATRGRAEGLRRNGRLSVRTTDLGDHAPRPEVVAEGTSTWARCLGDTAAVVGGAGVDIGVHRERWRAAEPMDEVAKATLTEYLRAVSEEIGTKTAETVAEIAKRERDATTALLLATAECEEFAHKARAAVEACGVSSTATVSRRKKRLVNEGQINAIPVPDGTSGPQPQRLIPCGGGDR